MLAHATGSLIEHALEKDGDALAIYPTRESLKKVVKYNKVGSVQRTNFIQNLSATSGGSSTVFVSPQAGILSVMLALKLPDEVGTAYNTCALPQSWGFNAINYIQMRIGDSSLFQWSGKQLMLQAIRTAGSQSESQDLMKLAGNALYKDVVDGTTVNPFSTPQNLWAYMPISLPWCGAESRNAPMPLDTSLLNSNIQIVVNLKRPSEVVKVYANGAYPAGLSDSWDEAFIQLKQVIPLSGEHKMTRTGAPLTLPITFVQQENSTAVANVVAETSKEITISGFRSGSIQEVDFYFLKSTVDAKLNPFDYTLPYDIALQYMGEQLAVYRGFSSQLWTTLYSGRPCRIVQPRLAPVAGAVAVPYFSASDSVASWVQIPFEGLYMDLEAEEPISNSGIAIQNGLLNLTAKFIDDGDYTCYYTADLQAGISFSGAGSCDYVF